MRSVIETERLLLRPYTLDVVPAHHRALVTSSNFAEFQDLSEFLSFSTRAEQLEWLRSGIEEEQRKFAAGDAAVYAIFRSDRFQGCVDIRRISKTKWEFGYWVRQSAVGKRIAFEACAGMLTAASELQDLRLVEAHTDSANVRSKKLLARLGLTFTEKQVPNASPGHLSTGFDDVWAIRRGDLVRKIEEWSAS